MKTLPLLILFSLFQLSSYGVQDSLDIPATTKTEAKDNENRNEMVKDSFGYHQKGKNTKKEYKPPLVFKEWWFWLGLAVVLLGFKLFLFRKK